jgi:hypothetical protein
MSDGDYRSFNCFIGNPTSGIRGQLTLRGKDTETDEAYAKRVSRELATWCILGWVPERPFMPAATTATTSSASVPGDDAPEPSDLFPPATAPVASAPASPSANGSGNVMRIRMLKIAANTEGLPELHFYTHFDANSHKWPDLKYTLGKDQTDRVNNCLKLLNENGGRWTLGHLKPGSTYGNGTETSELDLDVTWAPAKDPKYKNVLSVIRHGRGAAA